MQLRRAVLCSAMEGNLCKASSVTWELLNVSHHPTNHTTESNYLWGVSIVNTVPDILQCSSLVTFPNLSFELLNLCWKFKGSAHKVMIFLCRKNRFFTISVPLRAATKVVAHHPVLTHSQMQSQVASVRAPGIWCCQHAPGWPEQFPVGADGWGSCFCQQRRHWGGLGSFQVSLL